METSPPDYAPAAVGAAVPLSTVVTSPFARLRVRALAGVTLLSVLAALLLVGAFDAITHRKADPRALAALLTAALGLPVLVLGRHAGLRWGRVLGAPLRRSDLPLIAVMLPVAMLTMASVYLIYAPLSYIVPGFVRRTLLDNPMFDVSTLGQWLLLVLGGVVFAPVAEEFLFRGLIMQRWAYRWGTRTGVMASSALFALGHGEWLGHFVFGVVMSLLYLRTRRLWVPITAHATHNFALAIPLLWRVVGHAPADPKETLASFRADAWAGFPILCAALLLGWMYLRLFWPAGSVRAALDGPVPYEGNCPEESELVG